MAYKMSASPSLPYNSLLRLVHASQRSAIHVPCDRGYSGPAEKQQRLVPTRDLDGGAQTRIGWITGFYETTAVPIYQYL